MRLLDRFWIWGQDTGCHHDKRFGWKIPGENHMDPVEGAQYLGGIPNCCRVVFDGKPKPPFDGETAKLTSFKQVVWSIIGDASSKRNDNGGHDLDEVLRQAERFPNVTGGVFDDFFRPRTKDARLTPEEMAVVARRLHEAPRPLSLWIVYYAALFSVDYSRWLELADVITFWSWTSAELAKAEENLNRIVEMTPGKRRLAGCYLFNYGDNCPVTKDEMSFQLELYKRFMQEGKLDGVVVCANTVADVGLEAVEYFRQWLLANQSCER